MLFRSAGLTVISGADGTSAIKVQGSLSALNDALNGLTYQALTDYFGADTLQIHVSDLGHTGSGGTQTTNGSIALAMRSVNDAPVANNESFTLAEDSTLVVNASGSVLRNDSDADNIFLALPPSTGLTAVLVTGPTHGSVTLNGDGTFSYIPNQDFNGTDSFTYVATDGSANSNTATVTLRVTPVNDAPVSNDDAFTGNQLETLHIPVTGVLGNDIDVDADPLTAILVTEPTKKYVFHKVYDSDYVVNVASSDADLQTSTVVEGTRSGTILIGASRERIGFDGSMNINILRRLAAQATSLFPVLRDVQLLRAYRGFRPYAPDHLPVVGEDALVKGLWHSAGHEGAGIGLAPGSAALITDAILGKPSFMDGAAFSPARFSKVAV